MARKFPYVKEILNELYDSAAEGGMMALTGAAALATAALLVTGLSGGLALAPVRRPHSGVRGSAARQARC